MNKAFLIGLLIGITGCRTTNIENATRPLGKQELLQFLNSKDWMVTKICVDGNCNEDFYEVNRSFGIKTDTDVRNSCRGEKGDFYILGEYIWEIDPETYETVETTLSCPDYFKIVELEGASNIVKIQICSHWGYFPAVMEIIDENTLKITSNSPAFDGKEVIKIYTK